MQIIVAFLCVVFLVKFEYRYFISKEKFSKLMSPLQVCIRIKVKRENQQGGESNGKDNERNRKKHLMTTFHTFISCCGRYNFVILFDTCNSKRFQSIGQ